MSMTVIEHYEVGSGGQASIEFTSIPDTYTDLYLVLSLRSDRSGQYGDGVVIKPNGSASNGTARYLQAYNGSVASGTRANISGGGAAAALTTASTFSSCSVYIPNYTSTSAKSISTDGVVEHNGTQAIQGIEANLWNPSPNVAITSLTINPEIGTNFVEFSSATLYGITAGSDGTTTVS